MTSAFLLNGRVNHVLSSATLQTTTKLQFRYLDTLRLRPVSGALCNDVLALRRLSPRLASPPGRPQHLTREKHPRAFPCFTECQPSPFLLLTISRSLPSSTANVRYALLTWNRHRQDFETPSFPSPSTCHPRQATGTPCPKPPILLNWCSRPHSL